MHIRTDLLSTAVIKQAVEDYRDIYVKCDIGDRDENNEEM